MKFTHYMSHTACIVGVLFALSACETANKQDEIIVTPPPSAATMPSMPQYGTLPNYDGQIASATSGAVTVYSLDGAPPAIAPQMHSGMTASPMTTYGDGSVTTYNLSSSSYMPTTHTGDADEQIFFKDGSARLGSIDKQKISSFAEKAKFAPVNKITVEGHASRPTQAGTDTVEAHVLNLKESMNRSFAVSKSLMQDGLPAEKIKTVSHGSVNATGDDVYDRRVDMIMGER